MATFSQSVPDWPDWPDQNVTTCWSPPKPGNLIICAIFEQKNHWKSTQNRPNLDNFVRPTQFSGIFDDFRQLFFTPRNFPPFFVKKSCFFNNFSFSAADLAYKFYRSKLMLHTVKWPFFSCFFNISQLILCHFRKSIRRFSRVQNGPPGIPEISRNFPDFPDFSRRCRNWRCVG